MQVAKRGGALPRAEHLVQGLRRIGDRHRALPLQGVECSYARELRAVSLRALALVAEARDVECIRGPQIVEVRVDLANARDDSWEGLDEHA